MNARELPAELRELAAASEPDGARHGLVIPHAHIAGIINRNYTGNETP